jgi:putative GTP pyrophosphokinase
VFVLGEVLATSAGDSAGYRKRYGELKPLYRQLAAEVADTLRSKLKGADIDLVTVSSRVKNTDSVLEKITRKQYQDPFRQMTDLAGVRVVCPYEADLGQISEIVEQAFKVRERIDKAVALGADRMGYQGRAFVVELGPGYAGGRYEGITALPCEIQVRTILQDAWAIIDHQLVYKNKDATPVRVRRDLNNVGSLLEIAQGIFDSIRDKRSGYIREIAQVEDESRKRGDPARFLSQPVDLDTVLAYARWKFPDLSASEKLTQSLLRDLDVRAYPTLERLNEAVDRAAPAVAIYRNEMPGWFKSSTDFLTKSLGFVDQGFRQRHGFSQNTREAFQRLGHLVTPAA